MFFATAVMGISGSLVGIAIAISSLWDGVSDPLIGYLSDNNRNKFFGKRLGFMFFGIFAIAFLNICIWSMPSSMHEIAKFFWLLIGMLAIETANTFFGTPYAALAIDIAPDYNEQSKIQSFKTIFSINKHSNFTHSNRVYPYCAYKFMYVDFFGINNHIFNFALHKKK